MPAYRKKPVVVEARQLEAIGGNNAAELAEFCRGRVVNDEHPKDYERRYYVMVPTLEGELLASPGDYIVKGGKHGECWPVRQDIFEDTYEAARTSGEAGQ